MTSAKFKVKLDTDSSGNLFIRVYGVVFISDSDIKASYLRVVSYDKWIG